MNDCPACGASDCTPDTCPGAAAWKPFDIGQIVTHLGDNSGGEVFKVTGYGKDGSVTLWGGAKGAYAYRNLMPRNLMRWYGDGPKKVDGAAAPASRKAGKR